MSGQRSRTKEILPWYRQKNYKGGLSEHEKRFLDSFRLEDKHPSASYGDLPEEVRHYITHLEHKIYDAEQGKVFFGCAFVSFLGGLLLYDWWIPPSKWSSEAWFPELTAPFSVLLILLPWVYWFYEERRLTREYMPRDDPNRPTNEGIKEQWERDVITYRRSRKSREGEG